MARIISFEEVAAGNDRLHGPVHCGHKIFPGPDGPILQLDTYGSTERQIEGKVSQTLQIDRTAAEQLMKLLRTAFPSLRD